MFDFEHDFEHAENSGTRFVGFAEFDTVALGVVKIQRARAPEGVFVEVERARQTVVPVVVFGCGNRERVVGVKPAAREASRATEHEVSVASGKSGLAVVFPDSIEVEILAVERASTVCIFDFERKPVECGNHARCTDRDRINVRHRRAHPPPPRVAGMPMKGSGKAEYEEIDRFDGGVGWIAYPDERMQRASHALVTDEGVWLVDPVDADGVDDLLAELGEVAGVVVLLDRHKRDSAEIARRHDVSVHIPSWMSGVESDIGAPVERFSGALARTDYRLRKISTPLWQEAALYHETERTLVVSEAVGTAEYVRTDAERLGVHPALRLLPPRRSFRGLAPEHILVGHGAGVHENASGALSEALSGSRRRAPSLYAKAARLFLSG